MAEWRALRGWTRDELAARLASLDRLERSFDEADVDREAGWRLERFEAVVARERPGPPGAAFARARAAVASYRFSDPSIVTGYFDRGAPLIGRRMLLELRVLGLRFLNGVIVADVIDGVVDERSDRASTFGFRYDTLDGHLERGWEWFVLTKDHASGEIRFSIRSCWKGGQFPTWWSRVGFALLSGHYRAMWLRHAHERLASIARAPEPRFGGRRSRWRRDGAAGRDRMRQRRNVEHAPSSSSAAALAAAAGALSGLRSMAGTTIVGVANTLDPPASTSAIVRVSSSPLAASLIAAMAAGEMLADKHPRIPPRTSPAAWSARVVLGGLAGAGIAARSRQSALAGALAGALAAAVTTKLAYGARARLAERYRAGSPVPGSIEDGVVLAAGAALVWALVR